MAFTFDTSSAVFIDMARPLAPEDEAWWETPQEVRWSDLSPFVQGYIEALMGDALSLYNVATPPGFHNLAPSTLARIMEDCERMRADCPKMPSAEHERDLGACHWQSRQFGEMPDFPPQTPRLGEDGLVYLKERA